MKHLGLFAAGVLFGTAGLKILSSKEAKTVYAHTTAAVLRAKDCVMQTVTTIREGADDIYADVQAYAESQGYSIVREYVGHGIGRNMHEAPEVPNYGRPGHGPRLLRGMTIAVEPMVNAGSAAIVQMPDGWTVRTADGKYAAHYENTVLITAGDPELLTDPEGSLV